MPLLLTGEKFHDDLYKYGCLAVFAPLEGGYETRLLRRMRAKGFKTMISSARGLGDPEVFLLKLHGVRPPHLGHQNIGRNGALGEVQQVIPQAAELFNDNDKKKLLWKEIYENAVIDRMNAFMLFTDVYTTMSGGANDHVQLGAIMAKYLERMNKSNDQLVKLAELMQKSDVEVEEEDLDLEDVYDKIDSKKIVLKSSE